MMISKLATQIGGVFKSGGVRSAVKCAAIGGAALMTFAANAVVVTSSASNITIPANAIGIYINVVTGVFNAAPASVPGWDINPYGTAAASFFNPAAPTGGVYATNGSTTPANLPSGFVIGSTTVYGSGTATFPSFQLNATNYFGFRFLNEANSQIHYGYGTLIVGATAATKTVGSLFYESVPGASITVTPVPEPASVAMMLLGGLGVAGVVARRRRQSAA